MHLSYTTHIASLHYIENFSTYVVSRRHQHIAYFTTSLQEHREVNRSKDQGKKKKHRRFLERSNEIMESSINTAKLKGQMVKVNPVFPRNVSRHVGLNRFEPDFPRNVSRHIYPLCNMGLCASIRLVFLTLVSHCFAFHRNVKFFKCQSLYGKNPEKVYRQQTFRVNCRRYG